MKKKKISFGLWLVALCVSFVNANYDTELKGQRYVVKGEGSKTVLNLPT